MVGVTGLEPATFRTPCERASQLRHTPPYVKYFTIVLYFYDVIYQYVNTKSPIE